MKSHCTEEELTLYYYGEGRRRAAIDAHLAGCGACSALYREIAGTLAMVAADEAPERGDQYGLEVWQRIRHRLPEQERSVLGRIIPFGGAPRLFVLDRAGALGLLAAAAVLLIAAFVAGRAWGPRSAVDQPVASAGSSESAAANAASSDRGRRRILLTAVADHLDRSERVLTDIMNAPARTDISSEQAWAEDLLTTSRLYRQDALDAGERSIASVLDDLERSLLEIVHSSSSISAGDLEQIRRRIDATALLFKVRVMGDQLRQLDAAPDDRPAPRTSTSSSKIS